MKIRHGIVPLACVLALVGSLSIAGQAGARIQLAQVPGRPTHVSVSPMDSALGVSWKAPRSNGGAPIKDYVATAAQVGNGSKSKCTTTGATTCVISGLVNGQPYSVTVRAKNKAGLSAPSNAVIGTPAAAGGIGFNDPYDIAFDGSNLWVTNDGNNSVVEFSRSGSLVRSLSGGSYGFDGPSDIAVAGGHLWVTNELGNSVTELNTSDGSWVRTISGGSYGFVFPAGIAFDGTHLWVANTEANSVTEVNASDGSWVQTLSSGSYGFDVPTSVTVDGSGVWVAKLSR